MQSRRPQVLKSFLTLSSLTSYIQSTSSSYNLCLQIQPRSDRSLPPQSPPHWPTQSSPHLQFRNSLPTAASLTPTVYSHAAAREALSKPKSRRGTPLLQSIEWSSNCLVKTQLLTITYTQTFKKSNNNTAPNKPGAGNHEDLSERRKWLTPSVP